MPPIVIKVPKAPRSSFNMHRPLSKNTLLENQVRHFKELEEKLPPEHRTGIPHQAIQTEAQASEYIQKMTALLHARGGTHPKKFEKAT
jgi:hypothetical protein